jgi:hypothetical protein
VTIIVTANEQGYMVDHGSISANPPGNWTHERTAVTFVSQPATHISTATTGTTTTSGTTTSTTQSHTTTTTSH